jgi:hypothetical protein
MGATRRRVAPIDQQARDRRQLGVAPGQDAQMGSAAGSPHQAACALGGWRHRDATRTPGGGEHASRA